MGSVTLQPTRRSLLKGVGGLVISFALPAGAGGLAGATAAAAADIVLQPQPSQLDSYLAIDAQGLVTVFFGKIDGGQGLDAAIAQIVAEELDVPPARVHVVMGDTALTVNQGGASNASGISQGAVPLRNAAAEARLTLLEMAARRFAVPVERLSVADGVISVAGQPGSDISYAALIGGHPFDVGMEWNRKFGNDLNVKGRAVPKKVADYKVVGTPQPRRDIPDKVFARHDYVTDVKVPGMLHARMVRPPRAGARAGHRG